MIEKLEMRNHISFSQGCNLTSMMADSMLFTSLVVCIKLVKTPCVRQKNKHHNNDQPQRTTDHWS